MLLGDVYNVSLITETIQIQPLDTPNCKLMKNCSVLEGNSSMLKFGFTLTQPNKLTTIKLCTLELTQNDTTHTLLLTISLMMSKKGHL
jgi:hypothetical protein